MYIQLLTSCDFTLYYRQIFFKQDVLYVIILNTGLLKNINNTMIITVTLEKNKKM